MKIYDNGTIREMTAEEIAELEVQNETAERAYWQSINYNDAVNTKIREKYSESQEFAILRQKDEKPMEYSAYYEYCEACKVFVKEKKSQYGDLE